MEQVKTTFVCRINYSFINILDISTNQKLQVENIMKKVLGVAFMPEELAGIFTILHKDLG